MQIRIVDYLDPTIITTSDAQDERLIHQQTPKMTRLATKIQEYVTKHTIIRTIAA